jgi:ribosomal protein S18 acetylase RimI-like enzyme
MTTTIRRMREEDIAAVQNIARTTWAHTYSSFIPEATQTMFLERAYSDTSLRRRMKHGLFLVAEAERQVVGYANFVHHGGHSAELVAIYVLPQWHGRGFGSALLAAGLREMLNIKRLVVQVERDNATGRRFYEAKGFRLMRELVVPAVGRNWQLLELTLDV